MWSWEQGEQLYYSIVWVTLSKSNCHVFGKPVQILANSKLYLDKVVPQNCKKEDRMVTEANSPSKGVTAYKGWDWSTGAPDNHLRALHKWRLYGRVTIRKLLLRKSCMKSQEWLREDVFFLVWWDQDYTVFWQVSKYCVWCKHNAGHTSVNTIPTVKYGGGSMRYLGILFILRTWASCQNWKENGWSKIQGNIPRELASAWEELDVLGGQWSQAQGQKQCRSG